MTKYTKPRITSQVAAIAVINSNNNPLSKVAHVQDSISPNGTSAGYEADEQHLNRSPAISVLSRWPEAAIPTAICLALLFVPHPSQFGRESRNLRKSSQRWYWSLSPGSLLSRL